MSAETKYNGGNGPALRRRFQDGNWRRREGVWSCQWREYVTDPDGIYKIQWRRKSFPGLSERAAKAAMAPFLTRSTPRTKQKLNLRSPNARTLNNVIDEWRKLIAPNHKPRGLETSESHFTAHIVPELGDVAFRSWTPTVSRIRQ